MSKIEFLEGQQIYLRPLEVEDLSKNYQSWLNDAEVCQFNSHAIFPYYYENLKEYYEYTRSNPTSQIILAIIGKQENKHIGNISLQSINWISREAEFALLIGDKSYWGKGIASEAASLMFDYGFSRLNLNRIQFGTSSENLAIHKLAIKLKMKQEGIRRQAIYKEGKYSDIIEFGVLREEFYKA